ncbi:MAG: hypothetical protein K1X53_01640 [Candidatus Sumerlaeaceae bacterium]|nr:hypothetical protein [Candidatus Sumerlaeaceae bacterium]
MPKQDAENRKRGAALHQRVIEFINSPAAATDDAFNQLALDIWRFQIETNEFYRRFSAAARAPEPQSWREILPLPAAAFKRGEIRCFPPQDSKTFFETSGTTEAETGRHYFSTLEIYETALMATFRKFVSPDLDKARCLILTPPPSEVPRSSLVHMMQTLVTHLGTQESSYYVTGNDLQSESLIEDLATSEKQGQPILLMGTAFAFVHALDAAVQAGRTFALPAGSRIMETGGFKGRTREIPRLEFYRQLSAVFGIPEWRIINEYGMTELSSQFYDRSLVDETPGCLKVDSHWTRVLAVDPDSGRPVEPGRPGLLRIMDLANLGSVIALQTEDVGVIHDRGFEVRGRVPRSTPRGCSLPAEHYKSQIRGKAT